jgi:hypothetical protein
MFRKIQQNFSKVNTLFTSLLNWLKTVKQKSNFKTSGCIGPQRIKIKRVLQSDRASSILYIECKTKALVNEISRQFHQCFLRTFFVRMSFRQLFLVKCM